MAVDERAVVAAVSGLGIRGNEEGMIPAFGLYLTKHLADHYNRLSFGLVEAFLRESPELEQDAAALLVEAGQVCAFNTFGGIMLSPEWDAVVKPMIASREDWVHGMVAVINAFGWGRWSVRSLVPGESLEVRIEDGYEATGYARDYAKSSAPRCFLARGGVAGLMNLLYEGDITKRPVLDDRYYVEVFRSSRSFRAEETRCVAKGDPHCEIVGRRRGA